MNHKIRFMTSITILHVSAPRYQQGRSVPRLPSCTCILLF